MADEYLRRNLLVAKACGAAAGVRTIQMRLRQTKRPAKWLLMALEEIADRIRPLAGELADHRNEINPPSTTRGSK